MVAAQLLTITWVPAAAWACFACGWLAPTVESGYFKLNATRILTTPGLNSTDEAPLASG